MSLRRAALLVLTSALFACTDAEQDGAPDELVTVALYSPPRANPADCATPAPAPSIPLPNDLALQRAPGLPEGIQRELLFSFVAQGGWPSDQAQPITLPIFRRTRDAATGEYVPAAGPAGLDAATLNDGTVALLRTDGAAIERVPFTATYAPPAAGAPAGTPGVLRIAPTSGRWAAGARYVAALRAGDRGVKTADGVALGADSPIALIAPDRDLSIRENQPLGNIPDAACSPAGNDDEVRTLETLRNLYGTPKVWTPVPAAAACQQAGVPVAPCWLPVPPPAGASVPSAFDAVATVFPHEEIASIQTFTTQAGTRPVTDAAGGSVPLPSDFLLDPATGKVRNVPSFGPAAAGLATLDGFSTTAPLLIPLSGPVSAATLVKPNVRVYKLPDLSAPLADLTDLATGGTPLLVTQPPQFVSSGAATTIALAPAVAVEDLPVGGGATVDVYVPPLDEKSRYLVVVTNGVQDVAGQPLKRSTLMDIVFSFSSPLYDDNGTPADASDDVNHAASLGLSAADARGLQGLRTQLKPVLTGLGLADCTGTSTCAALAYTVTTQSVKDVTIGLSGLPYLLEAAAGAPVFVPGTPADFDTNASVGIPSVAFPTVARFLRVDVPTVNALVGRVVDGAPDPLNGALDPRLADLQRPVDDPAFGAAVQYFLAPERSQQLPALIAVPTRAAVTAAGFAACPWAPSGPPCVPLVVFQHGINGAAYQSLAFVDALAAKGFAVVAIDAPYHGDRSLCTSDAECVALDGTSAGVCTPLPERQTATDATPPGTCLGANSANRISSLAAQASGNFFVSSNFFRTRDASRQIVIDHSALTLALARPPGGAADPLQQALATGDDALIIDPRAVYLAGYSLGGQWGAPIAATNPRYRAATFTAAGGTLVDVFTSIQVPEYQQTLAEVFAGLGIDLTKVQPGPNFDPAVAARYVQALALAKWILDPVEPLNYAAPLRTAKAYAPGLQGLVDAGMGSATTDTYGQLFTGVEVNGVPTSDALFQSRYSRLFYELAGIDYTTYQSASITDGRVLHGLLLANFVNPPDVPMQGGLVIRDDLASFLLDRAFPGDAVAIP